MADRPAATGLLPLPEVSGPHSAGAGVKTRIPSIDLNPGIARRLTSGSRRRTSSSSVAVGALSPGRPRPAETRSLAGPSRQARRAQSSAAEGRLHPSSSPTGGLTDVCGHRSPIDTTSAGARLSSSRRDPSQSSIAIDDCSRDDGGDRQRAERGGERRTAQRENARSTPSTKAQASAHVKSERSLFCPIVR